MSEPSRTEQEINATLREVFLRSCIDLVNRPCVAHMYDRIKVEGTFKGVDRDMGQVHLQEMKTPCATYSYGTVRLSDCFYIEINDS